MIKRFSTPFRILRATEKLVGHSKPVGVISDDAERLWLLLNCERLLDLLRSNVNAMTDFKRSWLSDYRYREELIRHRISLFALSIDQAAIDRMDINSDVTSTALGMTVRERQEYPSPTKAS